MYFKSAFIFLPNTIYQQTNNLFFNIWNLKDTFMKLQKHPSLSINPNAPLEFQLAAI